MSDKTVFACSPTNWNTRNFVPGSVKIIADCGHEVWVAPSGIALIKEREGDALFESRCIPCAIADPEFQDRVKQQGPAEVPGQREELAKALGQETANEFLDLLYGRNKP